MTLAIQDVRILRGDDRPPIERGVIIIEGTQIAYAGDADDAPALSEGSKTVSLPGRTALPGLIDSHTHLAMDEADIASPRLHYQKGEVDGILRAAARGRRCVENGITTVRDCNAPGEGLVALRAIFSEEVMPGPRLFLSGQAICATGGHMHALSYEADGADEVRKGVRQQLKIGADFIKLVAEASSAGGAFQRPTLQLSVEEMAAGVEVAHRLGVKATAHAVSRHGIADALGAGVDCIEHGYDLTSAQMEQMAANGTWLVPTLSVHDAILRHGPTAGWDPERLPRSEQLREMAVATLAQAHAAGVRIACGSDAGSPLNPVWDLMPELLLMERAGLRPPEVIAAATSAAAELLDAQERIGRLDDGLLADVLVVRGRPDENLSALREIEVVLKGGAVVGGSHDLSST